jgi:hypothetical protein
MVEDLFNMQSMMILMVVCGNILGKKKLISKEGQKSCTELLLKVVLPCNILLAYLKADRSMLTQLFPIFLFSLFFHILATILSRILYNNIPDSKRSSLMYATIISNGGLLGNSVIDNLYGAKGLLYASIHLIPLRIFMWTFGLACFVRINKKNVLKTFFTNPCICAVLIGLIMMFCNITFPYFIEKTITAFSNCLTPITMLLIGVILSNISLKNIFSKGSFFISAIRLLILPSLCLLLCNLLNLDPFSTKISTLIIAMPAASTTALLAAKYGKDEIFATKCVSLTTLLSMITIPFWGYILS